MSRRRRHRTSPLRTIAAWSIAVAVICWGIWQAAALRHTLQNAWNSQRTLATQPQMAVAAAQVTATGAQGGEPLTAPAPSGMIPPELPDGSEPAAVMDPLVPPKSAADPDGDSALLEKTPVFDPALSAPELAARGKKLLDAGQPIAGRFALNAALARTQDSAMAAQLRAALSDLNVPVFLGTAILPDDPCARYVDIHEGDSFLKLGREFGVPAAFIQAINPSLSPSRLKPLTGVKIVQGPFHARISKSEHRLDLYARDIFSARSGSPFPKATNSRAANTR